MAIISFYGYDKKETGQTLSTVAVATTMALEHNFRTIIIGTDYNDKTLSECYWPAEENNRSIQSALGLSNQANVGTISGIEGLGAVVQSGRIGANVVGNYTKPVFKEKRLDVLLPPESASKEKYNAACEFYPEVIKMADMDYNLVFVDVSKDMPEAIKNKVLQSSHIIAVGLKQGMNSINKFMEIRKKNEIFSKSNIIIFIGKYDGYSKYNLKNLERYFRGKYATVGISYNTLFSEAATEGRVVDYFFKMRSVTNPLDRNTIFMEQNRYACECIKDKIRELQVR